MEEAKYSLSIPLPKASQYDASTTLTIRAEHSEELKNSVAALLGEGTLERLAARALQATLVDPTPVAAPAPVASAPVAPAPAVTPVTAAPAASLGACPACGTGQLVKRERKDKSGSFTGCSTFPTCRYIA